MAKKKQGKKKVSGVEFTKPKQQEQKQEAKPEITMRDIKRYVGIAGLVFLVLALIVDLYATALSLVAVTCVYVGLTNNFRLERKEAK